MCLLDACSLSTVGLRLHWLQDNFSIGPPFDAIKDVM